MEQKSWPNLNAFEKVLLWVLTALWVAVFLGGTLVASQPYREGFATFEGGVGGTFRNGVVVVLTYTLTNVGILCILAGVLGQLGSKAVLVADSQKNQERPPDVTSPMSSAALRSFLVYLAFLAGVLLLGEEPAAPGQTQYVRLAGAISLVGFVVNYRPAFFGQLLERASRLFGDGRPATTSAK